MKDEHSHILDDDWPLVILEIIIVFLVGSVSRLYSFCIFLVFSSVYNDSLDCISFVLEFQQRMEYEGIIEKSLSYYCPLPAYSDIFIRSWYILYMHVLKNFLHGRSLTVY